MNYTKWYGQNRSPYWLKNMAYRMSGLPRSARRIIYLDHLLVIGLESSQASRMILSFINLLLGGG